MFVIENSNENKDTPDTDVSRYRKSTFIIQFKGNEIVKKLALTTERNVSTIGTMSLNERNHKKSQIESLHCFPSSGMLLKNQITCIVLNGLALNNRQHQWIRNKYNGFLIKKIINLKIA